MKFTPIHKIVKTTNTQEYLDVHYGVSNDAWTKEIVIKMFGILIYKHARQLTVDSKILDKEGKPLGFKES